MRRRLSLLAVVLVAACGHATAFEDGVLHKGELAVRVGPIPSGWKRVTVEGADLAFRDEAQEASAMFDIHCARRDGDVPLSALTAQLLMGTTQRDFVNQQVVPFDGREALHTMLRAKLDGVPMQYDIYVMKKDGCVYDLVYVAAPETFAAGTEGFERFAKGLQTASPAGSADRASNQ